MQVRNGFKVKIQYVDTVDTNPEWIQSKDTCKSGMDSKQRYSSSGIQNVLLKTDSMSTLLIHASPEWIRSKDLKCSTQNREYVNTVNTCCMQ